MPGTLLHQGHYHYVPNLKIRSGLFCSASEPVLKGSGSSLMGLPRQVPGTPISYVDRAVSEGWQVSPILHNWQNEEPTLLTALFNRVLCDLLE